MARPDQAPVVLACRKLAGGKAAGEAIVCRDRISFWGGFDPKTGLIVDPYHELRGQSVAGKVMVFTSTKGSSGTSAMLALAQRANKAPVGFINVEIDCMAVLGCLVTGVPLVALTEADPFAVISNGDWVEIDADAGEVRVWKKG